MSLSSQKYGVWDPGSGKTYFGVKKAFLDPDPVQGWKKTQKFFFKKPSPVGFLGFFGFFGFFCFFLGFFA